VLLGPLTFLKLAWYKGRKKETDFAEEIANVYADILSKFDSLDAEWVQIDEPYLVKDLTKNDISLFQKIYEKLLSKKGKVKVILQTYFGDIRDCYKEVISLPFSGIGLDFVEGIETLSLLQKNGFPKEKTLFAGIVNGKNIWRSNYKEKDLLINELKKYAENIILSSSCSLLHVPYSLKGEDNIDEKIKSRLAFAEEKLLELVELSSGNIKEKTMLEFEREDIRVRSELKKLTPADYERLPKVEERREVQKRILNLPKLPTTTIGSFPQTKEVRENRRKFKSGEITKLEYDNKVKELTAACVKRQDELGLDVLVHGEFERNDMVEYFGENLSGFLFTKEGRVQSYGMRLVKPPIIYKDVYREKPMTVDIITYAKSQTKKPVKGMLTGPATILNWSFPREDIPLKDSAMQIAIAIRDEVLDLEAAGIKIIQVDEAAFREKLPLRKSDWHKYLDWAVPAFRIVHSRLKKETQLHTHMCYSEFTDIINDIDAMDADVITFEASRSNLEVVQAIKDSGFRAEVGPGVYDIHSPRVPTKKEILATLSAILEKIPIEKVWVNPDCGLKTRDNKEVWASLENMVAARKDYETTTR
jgi:5-methyltetrahydropteroyltriglutamate--homocysteine methyltransferase